MRDGVAARDVDENALAARLNAPEHARARPRDPHLRRAAASRTSCSGSRPTPSTCSCDTLWPDFGERDLRAGAGRVRGPPPALRRPVSDLLVAARRRRSGRCRSSLGGAVARRLVPVRARRRRGALALHELYRMARGLRPIVLAGYCGAVAALVGAETGRRRVDARRPARSRSRSCSSSPPCRDTRQSATVSIGDDRVRRRLDRLRARAPDPAAREPRDGRTSIFAVAPRASSPPTSSPTSAGGSRAATGWRRRSRRGRPGRASSAGAACDRRDLRSSSSTTGFHDGRRCCSASAVGARGAARRPVRVAREARPRREGLGARCWSATAACSTGSTRCSSRPRPRFYALARR